MKMIPGKPLDQGVGCAKAKASNVFRISIVGLFSGAVRSTGKWQII